MANDNIINIEVNEGLIEWHKTMHQLAESMKDETEENKFNMEFVMDLFNTLVSKGCPPDIIMPSVMEVVTKYFGDELSDNDPEEES